MFDCQRVDDLWCGKTNAMNRPFGDDFYPFLVNLGTVHGFTKFGELPGMAHRFATSGGFPHHGIITIEISNNPIVGLVMSNLPIVWGPFLSGFRMPLKMVMIPRTSWDLGFNGDILGMCQWPAHGWFKNQPFLGRHPRPGAVLVSDRVRDDARNM